MILLAGTTEARVVSYYYTDPHGSVLAITDETGLVTASREYRPYGAALSSEGNGERGFGGHVIDAEFGLTYMQARYYDAQIGRFLSSDPLTYMPGDSRSIGRYQYGSNNPFTFNDPTGMASCSALEARGCTDIVSPRGMIETSDGSSRFAVETGTTQDTHVAGCDTSECDEVKATREKFMRESASTLKEAGAYGAKEGGMLLIGGAISKALGRVAGILRIGGPSVSFAGKVEGQLAKRGWTKGLVEQTVRSPSRAVATRDTRFLSGGAGRMDDPATAYYNKSGGYVVRNDVTGDVVQVSNRNDSNWIAPWD